MDCLKPSKIQTLMKAKYIKREGTPGNYKYTYAEGKGPGSASQKEIDDYWDSHKDQPTGIPFEQAAKKLVDTLSEEDLQRVYAKTGTEKMSDTEIVAAMKKYGIKPHVDKKNAPEKKPTGARENYGKKPGLLFRGSELHGSKKRALARLAFSKMAHLGKEGVYDSKSFSVKRHKSGGFIVTDKREGKKYHVQFSEGAHTGVMGMSQNKARVLEVARE